MKKRLVMGMMGISSILNNPLSVLAGNLDGMESGGTGGSSLNADDAVVGDIIRNHRGVTAEQMAIASNALSPFTNFCGALVGGAVAIIYAGVFVITAADLLYISLPPLRPLLLKNQQGEGSKLQLISDEALSIVANGGNGGGSSSGGGMMGSGMMDGGFGAQPQSGGSSKGDSKLVAYFKARFLFMTFLVITTMVLTSSAIMGTGVNLAGWGLKLLQLFNDFTSVWG